MNVNQECHPLFGHSFLPLTKTRRLILVGTPKVHSCTNGTPLYIRCIQRPHHVHFLSKNNRGPVFHVWNSHAYLKRHSLDNQRVGVPGMNIFTHLRVSAPGTGRSIGVPDFQVRETIRTWNGIYLIANELIFQVWIYSRTWSLRHIMVCRALDPHNIMSGWFWRRYIPLTDTVTLVSFFVCLQTLGCRHDTEEDSQLIYISFNL